VASVLQAGVVAEKYIRMPSAIHTFTGRLVDPLDLNPDDVCIEDVAHHLSNQCRFSGGTAFHYSVAQHAYYASKLVEPEFAWDALHHDDAEYLLQDMAKPLKNHPHLGQAYRGAEARVEKIIGEVFGVQFPMPPEVKEADERMLITEAADIMHGTSKWEWVPDVERAPFTIKKWSPEKAEAKFLARYNELREAQ